MVVITLHVDNSNETMQMYHFYQFEIIFGHFSNYFKFTFVVTQTHVCSFCFFFLFRSTNEVRDIHKEQMNEMEIRLSNSKQSESMLIDEISKLKNEYITEKAKYESEQNRTQQQINEQLAR